MEVKPFKKILIANRGEIAIRVIRAANELGLRSIAVYSKEDKLALFRSKADESYMLDKENTPVGAYLNIYKILEIAKLRNASAIHPGYGFLAENPDFVRACEREDIIFIGPPADVMEIFGDKVAAKKFAKKIGIPVLGGTDKPVSDEKELVQTAKEIGYPIILKASFGGGGRGMRVVHDESALIKEYKTAVSEAQKAFGNGDVFIEKYLEAPKHIEVQILADKYGNVVHLFERDCSIQRRHQKVIEFTPSLAIDDEKRQKICSDAVKLAKEVGYVNAGTVEFLLDSQGNHYFMEMNPRIQVEHTVTEMTTGIDLVQAQILIAQGYALNSEEIGIYSQKDIIPRGSAIQCRITAEDPKNKFMPDTGKITVYRTAAGNGIRLDGGNGFTGAEITPYYDSLLVKTIVWDSTFEKARRKALRALKEHYVEGVKTNTDFLINVLQHDLFKEGACNTMFIDQHPELFATRKSADDEAKLAKYLAEIIINKTQGEKKDYPVPIIPNVDGMPVKDGTKQILDKYGPQGVVDFIKSQKKLLVTDTTYRDAHQSLHATRMRTKDMLDISRAVSVYGWDLFSLEMWGGATFDTAYRFLHESPWTRLKRLRKRIPNIMFQMLLRGCNTVGYKNYPDNVVVAFVEESAKAGIDVYRIFDSLNWLEALKLPTEEVLKNNKVAEVCLCYTGDILDKSKKKYDLDYYIKKAKEIQGMGAHILGIKDMSGLCRPQAAYELVKALKEEIDIPIHFHTHDTAGNAVASVLNAARAGVDIADMALNAMSGLTSQPALNSIVAALKNTEKDTELDEFGMQLLSDYWENVRPVYYEAESGLRTPTAEIYRYEVPGGQFSNLKQQAESFGLGHRFRDLLEKYKDANELFGDIVKVTPSSKSVGDMALFMMQNDLTVENIYEKGKNLAFPDSVVDFFKGMLGQPEGGFDEELQKIVLKGQEPLTVRPGTLLEAVDFDEIRRDYLQRYGKELNMRSVLSAALYPKVYDEYMKFLNDYGDYVQMESHVFFNSLKVGEETEVEIAKGVRCMIKLVHIGTKVGEDGYRKFIFEINGFRRDIYVKDENSIPAVFKTTVKMADAGNANHISPPIKGTVMAIHVSAGEKVKKNQPLAVVEAMKMETEITSPKDGTISNILIAQGDGVEKGQLIMELE
ncbi:MAG: pyruvate carboxylase [Eubacteriaceae bacterium]|nr:pyruvate carboxylase [Eubacteriaceae bacterium]